MSMVDCTVDRSHDCNLSTVPLSHRGGLINHLNSPEYSLKLGNWQTNSRYF
jgi:hypothetical protein